VWSVLNDHPVSLGVTYGQHLTIIQLV
jgi:hypothetical protein